jgi:hypothetical protein
MKNQRLELRHSRSWLILCCLVIGQLSAAYGQLVTGSITGNIYDPSGAPVPNAKVTATNVLTGVATSREADPAGLYLITNLLPGNYQLIVEAKGFQRFVQQNIDLKVDSKMNIDVNLVLGEITQEITVSAAPAMLKTEKSDVSLEIPEEMVKSLPTLGRNVSRLHFTAPGTTRFRANDTWFQNENPTLGAASSTNGRFWGENDYTFDGVTNVEYGITGMQIMNPNQDSIQEVKLTTSDYDAELGQIGGLVAQYVSKSGTNDLHGSLFWFNRNDVFFAANPFNEKVPCTGEEGKGTGPAPFNWNQQGFSLGGPIKKNRMFLFGDYQATRTRQGGSILTTFPVADFQRGDLRRALGDPIQDSNGNPVMVTTLEGAVVPARQNMIFDPLSGNPDGTGRRAFSCNGQVNMICPDRFNPVTVNLLNLLNGESQGLAVNQALLNNNLAASGSSLFNQDQFDVRFDANINDSNKIFTRYTQFRSKQDNPPLYGLAGGPGFAGGTPNIGTFRNHHAVVNYTHTFSPTFLTEARVGFARFGLQSYQWDVGNTTNENVGIRGINVAGDPVTEGLAAFRIDGPTGNFDMGFGTMTAIPRFDYNTIFQYSTHWTKIRGGHEFRWGGDVFRQRSDFNSINESTRGDFSFNRLLTANADIPGTGMGMASFLLGTPSAFVRGKINFIATDRVWRMGFYFRDAWRVTPKLTVNYGIRWDFIGRPHPRNPAENSNYDPETNNLLLACVGQVSCTSNVDNDLNDFGPRLGIAYKLFSSTVIRAGYGRSYFASNFGGHLGTLGVNFPMQVRQNITQTNQFFAFPNPENGAPFTLDQAVPAAPIVQIPESGLLPLPPGLNVWSVPKDSETSELDTWNLTLQHQLSQNLSVSAGYVGSAARNIYDNLDINAPFPGAGPLNPRRRYFNLTGNAGPINLRCRCAASNYHSLLVQVEKRFAGGYSLISNYTWAKAIDVQFGGFGWAGQPNNPFDRRASRGISEYNRASALTIGHVWELPYGSGRRYGSSAPAVAKAVLGGWSFNGVTTAYSGFPVSILWGDGSSLNSTFGQRPDLVGDPRIDNPSRTRWFNPAAFANPRPYNWGNYGRNGGDLRGPSFFTADWALWKNFGFRSPLSENTTLEFRWETFNLFNNTNLDTPANTADSATAGQITAIEGTMRRMQFGLRLVW